MRRQLRKAAPHAFATPAKAAGPRVEARKPVRTAPRAVVNGAAAAADDGWEEF
jgi:hypothetical protein